MEASQIYIIIAIAALAVTALLLFVLRGKRKKQLSPLTGLAFGFVLAGIIFGDGRLVGYVLMGIGIAIAVVDMILKRKK